MNVGTFYRLLLPSAGQYTLFHVPTKRHIWCGSLDELVYKTEAIATATHSWYFGVASFKVKASGRTQANVLAKRALYLDIDAGPAKFEKDPANAYETADAALAALVGFSTSTGLVPSLVVSSGAGIHVYYALDADATPTAWQVVADQLKTAAKLCGLKADPTCTGDSARVLRPLGALHKNGATVRLLKATGKVWALAELQAKIEPLVPAVTAPLPTRRFENAADINDEVLGPARSEGGEAPERVASALAALSPDCSYETWRNIAWAVRDACGEDGYDIFDAWSAKAPRRYEADAVRNVWNSDSGRRGGVSAATLFHLARRAGWAEAKPATPPAIIVQATEEAAGLHDVGNALRLARALRGAWRYCLGWRRWLRWSEGRWHDATQHELRAAATEVLKQLLQEATSLAAAGKADEARRIFAHAQRSLSLSKLDAAIELLKDQPDFTVQVHELDRDPWLVQTRNGVVIDLRSGTARPAVPDDLLLHALGCDYSPDADCPIWRAAVQRWAAGDSGFEAYLQRLVGYLLTGMTTEQAFFFIYGMGANGKSQFASTVQRLLGDYAASAQPEVLMVQPNSNPSGPSPEIARLAGRRLVLMNETEDGQRLAEARVKQWTGGDVLTARMPYGPVFEFVPVFKLLMVGNHRPIIRGDDHGIWRRIQLIPFTRTFTAEERDPRLGEKLREELPGILNWAIEGARQWQAEGLNPPGLVTAGRDQYRADMDLTEQWLDECCERTAGAKYDGAQAYQSFSLWARDSGYQPVPRRRLTDRLADRGIQAYRSNGRTWYVGISPRARSMAPEPAAVHSVHI